MPGRVGEGAPEPAPGAIRQQRLLLADRQCHLDPERDTEIRKAVERVWEDFLQYVESKNDIKNERKKAKVQAALADYKDADVWAEVQRRKNPVSEPMKGLKQAEVETLLASQDEVGEDAPQSNFYARCHPLKSPRSPLMEMIERVVLVHRLREVITQVGFTRFESETPDIEGELDLGVRRGELAREVSWLPAVENHGEGIFLALESDAINRWLARAEVKKRGKALADGFDAAQRKHPSKVGFLGLPYVLVHSLSHLLITAVSLECGYSASSIRERIYATPAGYGLLLHTGTPDAEGTLGGLVQVGRRIEQTLSYALELGRLCSNDPVCAQHSPDNPHEERFLHGAACHGCLLISETSCERHNQLLDRAWWCPPSRALAPSSSARTCFDLPAARAL